MKIIYNLQAVLCIGKNYKCEIIDDTYFLYIRYLSCNGTESTDYYRYLDIFRELECNTLCDTFHSLSACLVEMCVMRRTFIMIMHGFVRQRELKCNYISDKEGPSYLLKEFFFDLTSFERLLSHLILSKILFCGCDVAFRVRSSS